MANENNSFPNMPVSHWQTLRAQFKKSIPGTISTNYLASVLGMSEPSARANVLSPLRLIGFIDENGNVDQEMARKYRDDNQYQKFCDELVKKLYPKELLDAFPDSDSDRSRVKSWFMNHTGVGETGANKMVAFYFALLEADPAVANKSTKKTKPTNPQSKKSKPEKKPDSAPKTESKVEHSTKFTSNDLREKYPGLNINIQVHISSDATPDQIEKIFEAMGKHIYNK